MLEREKHILKKHFSCQISCFSGKENKRGKVAAVTNSMAFVSQMQWMLSILAKQDTTTAITM